MRGELVVRVRRVKYFNGSSPHAWGTVVPLVEDTDYRRFIPTCVGNCSPPGWWRESSAVHPHMRGELMLPPSTLTATGGSSPHAWGTGRRAGPAHDYFRFIPTCVGNWRWRSLNTD